LDADMTDSCLLIGQKTSLVDSNFRQAAIAWGAFIVLNILLNGTVPFLLGADMHAWTASPFKGFLFNFIQYGLMFLVVPLVLVKGWETIHQPAFLIPLLIAVLSLMLRDLFKLIAALSVLALAYLHFRFDLSELGCRSRSWRADAVAAGFIAILFGTQRLFSPEPVAFDLREGMIAGLSRMFLNPASTTEYIFYFGFLAERFSHKLGTWWTPLLIGLMYTLHEMTNPEYWYEGMFFPMVFVGIVLFTAVYLRSRNVVAMWLGDSLGRFLARLF
jgi:hypothetical protein